ncbi:single-stranded DNA-binding protein [Streptomyces sp. NBS 14/10]|uniref:single-stranded DNA-binding protein n=1 Tax=Streptomyces sp. NBS 14/10 TaxID=1945643 RepID=UPI0015C62690|nr:single-stranded DNA-binding protein [Streptomyces sp. NBS 14/10]KAK1186024.1 single-stranded DNA-binding protein [Streptomyces sp. NBS 14/10]
MGNTATRPDYWETAAGVAVARFRLAVTARRWDRAREAWMDAYTSFYTVWAWRGLAVNVAASVSLGEPLVVHGTLRVRERAEERPGDRQGDRPGDRRGEQRGGWPGERPTERPGTERPGTGQSGTGPPGADRQGAERPGDRLRDRPRGQPGEWQREDGGGARRWITADIDAVTVGHDLARGTSAFHRVSRAKPLLNVPTGTTSP